MPDFDNLTTALRHRREPVRVPLFELSVDEEIKQHFLGKPADSLEREAEFFMKAGYDFAPLTIGIRQTTRGETSGLMGAKPTQTSLLKPAEARYNPFRQDTRTRMWAEEGAGLIRSQASFDNYAWPDPDEFSYQPVEQLGRLLPHEAKIIVNVGAIFTASWMFMGLESFFIALVETPDLVQQVIQKIGAIQTRVVENLLQFERIGAICMPDDLGYTGGLLVRPDILRKHVFPWNKRIGDMVHAKGLAYIYHSDGRIEKVIDDLVACGFDALHPCEPASTNIAELKSRYLGRLCLCGNIDLDSTLTLGTPEEVREEVKLRIKTVGPGGGYCCGSSNSVPEYVPFENYLAMIEATKEFGRYPIRV